MATYVEVVCPNGRWQKVKVTAKSSMLQVLEEVCMKQKFMPPNQYTLKHGKKNVDLTLSFRYSGLPNHSKLELIKAIEERKEEPVKVALQFPDGSRSVAEFEPQKFLWDILKEGISKASEDARKLFLRTDSSNHVCLYITERIVGEDALRKTQLRNLGLFGGRAIIRYVVEESCQEPIKPRKTPEKEVIADPVVKKPKIEEEGERAHMQDLPKCFEQIPSKTLLEKKSLTEAEPRLEESSYLETGSSAKSTSEVSIHLPMEQSEVKYDTISLTDGSATSHHSFGKPRADEESKVKSSSDSSVTQASGQKLNNSDETIDNDEGNREVIVYDSADAPEFKPKEESDKFFEVTVNDIRRMMEDLKASVENAFNQPLLTQKLRKEAMNLKFSVYKRAIIRFIFSNQIVIQACFKPTESLRIVYKFVKEVLQGNPKIQLYTTPPKKILSESDDNLIESFLVPLSKVHIKVLDRSEVLLKSDILQKLTSEENALSVIQKWNRKS